MNWEASLAGLAFLRCLSRHIGDTTNKPCIVFISAYFPKVKIEGLTTFDI